MLSDQPAEILVAAWHPGVTGVCAPVFPGAIDRERDAAGSFAEDPARVHGRLERRSSRVMTSAGGAVNHAGVRQVARATRYREPLKKGPDDASERDYTGTVYLRVYPNFWELCGHGLIRPPFQEVGHPEVHGAGMALAPLSDQRVPERSVRGVFQGVEHAGREGDPAAPKHPVARAPYPLRPVGDGHGPTGTVRPEPPRLPLQPRGEAGRHRRAAGQAGERPAAPVLGAAPVSGSRPTM